MRSSAYSTISAGVVGFGRADAASGASDVGPGAAFGERVADANRSFNSLEGAAAMPSCRTDIAALFPSWDDNNAAPRAKNTSGISLRIAFAASSSAIALPLQLSLRYK